MPLGNSFNIIKGGPKVRYFTFDITISSDTSAYDLSTVLKSMGWDEKQLVDGRITIDSGVTIGSAAGSPPSFSTLRIPVKSKIIIINNGSIIGKGGDGTFHVATPTKDNHGGDAMHLSTATHYLLNNGTIAGGGGSGASILASSGGGAGVPPGLGLAAVPGDFRTAVTLGGKTHLVNVTASESGTRTTGGLGATCSSTTNTQIGTPGFVYGKGGDGGGLASPGTASGGWVGQFRSGRNGGVAIVGKANLTIDSKSTGTILGGLT